MATLYSLNKDELVHLISMIEKNQKDKIIQLESQVANFERVLLGHTYEIVPCSVDNCCKFESLIDGQGEREMNTCDMCEKLFCNDHGKTCVYCDLTYCSLHTFYDGYCIRCTRKCKCGVVYGRDLSHECKI